MDEILDTEKAPKPRRKGRRSREETNKIRASLGLTVKVAPPKKDYRPPAILPEKTKAKAQEILATMLQGKSTLVVQKIMDKALDDDDADQMACLKLIMDRVLPADYLSKVKGKSNQIQINISGVGQDVVIADNEEVVDAEYEEENGE